MALGRWLLTSLAVLMTSQLRDVTAQVDATIREGTGGTDVVNSVVDLIRAKCILTTDRLFLRRVAYVETRDGTAVDTYRAGYDGGIWKVDQSMFQATSSCSGVLVTPCADIQREFNIDWTHVQWSDLRKPLYSGLAAALHIIRETNGNATAVPGSVSGQADFWVQHYDRAGTRANFTALANTPTTFDCNKPTDLVFILDSSGSIDDADFQLSLDFVAKVVEAMDVPSQVRVASLIFEDVATVQFDFDRYATKAQVMAAIRATARSSGGTATDLALDAARTQVFPGARQNAAKVAVVLTDGQSNDRSATRTAATRLKHDSGVEVFVVGIGGYDLLELRDVASDPACGHVYTLETFDQFNTILYEIQKSACQAHTTLVTSNATHQSNFTCDRPDLNDCGPIVILPPTSPDKTPITTVDVSCGIVDIYVSYTNPNPGPAFYSHKFTATDGHPAYISTSASQGERTLYMTVMGTNLPSQPGQLTNCSDFHYNVSVEEKNVVVKCCRGESCHPCTPVELRQEPSIREAVCANYYQEFPNPCTPAALEAGHVMFAYPYDQSKFVRCDYHGAPYVTQCPERMTFNPATLTCGFTSPGHMDHIPLPSSYPNPCTPAHIQAQYLYFDYPPDHQLFIHCDLFGDAWLQSCPALEVWSQKDQTCVADRPTNYVTTSRPHVATANPCADAAGQFFPYPCDHTRFIHCGPAGVYWVQFCPAGMYYDPATFICVLGDPQPHGEGC